MFFSAGMQTGLLAGLAAKFESESMKTKRTLSRKGQWTRVSHIPLTLNLAQEPETA